MPASTPTTSDKPVNTSHSGLCTILQFDRTITRRIMVKITLTSIFQPNSSGIGYMLLDCYATDTFNQGNASFRNIKGTARLNRNSLQNKPTGTITWEGKNNSLMDLTNLLIAKGFATKSQPK